MTKRVLGIDPGLLHTGWAVVDTAGQTRKYIASGVILPKTTLPFPERILICFVNNVNILEKMFLVQ